jgi:hypothetical protein
VPAKTSHESESGQGVLEPSYSRQTTFTPEPCGTRASRATARAAPPLAAADSVAPTTLTPYARRGRHQFGSNTCVDRQDRQRPRSGVTATLSQPLTRTRRVRARVQVRSIPAQSVFGQASCPAASAARAASGSGTVITNDCSHHDERPCPLVPPLGKRIGCVNWCCRMPADHPAGKGERVQLRFFNHSMMFHPMHLHGHTFALTRSGLRKDTVIVRPMQTVTVDLDATNPGQWMAHCHNIYHAERGMMTMLTYQ